MKTTTLYDFTLSANGTQVILADADFYKVLTSTGDLQVTRDGGATVKPMRAGRGERNVPFQRLTLKDLSGAPNSGTILVGDSDFIDDTIVISSAINVRPEVSSGSTNVTTALAANTAEQIVAPAANTGGIIVQSANALTFSASPAALVLLAKTSAPANSSDGELVAGPVGGLGVVAAGYMLTALQGPQFIAAGKGLYWIAQDAVNAAAAGQPTFRACRYKLL